jgi:hypothetical protein
MANALKEQLKAEVGVIRDQESRRDVLQRKSQIRIVVGFAEVIEREATLVAAACNQPNLLVLPFNFELIRTAAQRAPNHNRG